jgi:RNA-directed DNA polymerase
MSTIETPKPKWDTETKLARVAWLSAKDPHYEFTALMHFYNEESLLKCFQKLDGKKAVGIDKVTKDQYGENLIENLNHLLERMKKMAYRPGNIREALIEKEDKPGTYRPLGISNFEDKIIQMQTAKILESIYDPIFSDSSYGFRPGKSCHDAIKDLTHFLFKNEIETVIDIDMANFFGTIDHRILEDFMRMKIKDPKFMRYIIRMFKAGILSEGELKITEEGVPQGSICSPVMANIYAHHVIDTWIEREIQPRCQGRVKLFRYADDAIICCEYSRDAERIMDVLDKRLGRFKLKLNKDKTKVVPFSKDKARKGIQQGTFDFLGFTFYLGKSESGTVIPKIKTAKKRFVTKMKKVTMWVKENRNKYKLIPLWKTFGAKLRGHIQYYGVSHNYEQVKAFVEEAKRIFFKWINRRSQRNSMNWEKFTKFCEKYPLPAVTIRHRLF